MAGLEPVGLSSWPSFLTNDGRLLTHLSGKSPELEPKDLHPFKMVRRKVETVWPGAWLVYELLCWSMSEAAILCKMCWRWPLQNELLSDTTVRMASVCAHDAEWASELSPFSDSARPVLGILAEGLPVGSFSSIFLFVCLFFYIMK